MKTQTQLVFTIHPGPQPSAMNLQEYSCSPAPDSSLPAEAVLIDRMQDKSAPLLAPVFVP
jgi:hypothetical protein